MKELDPLTLECVLEWFRLSQSIGAFISASVGDERALNDLLGWLRLANWSPLAFLHNAK